MGHTSTKHMHTHVQDFMGIHVIFFYVQAWPSWVHGQTLLYSFIIISYIILRIFSWFCIAMYEHEPFKCTSVHDTDGWFQAMYNHMSRSCMHPLVILFSWMDVRAYTQMCTYVHHCIIMWFQPMYDRDHAWCGHTWHPTFKFQPFLVGFSCSFFFFNSSNITKSIHRIKISLVNLS